MERESTINPDTLKVGDVISKWARYSNRVTLGEGTSHFERQRHLIIGVSHSYISTVVLFWKPIPMGFAVTPGSNYDIPTASIRGVLNWRMSD